MKIMIAGGGSGGHIFPAASLMRELADKNPGLRIIFVISKRDEERRIFEYLKERGFTFKLKIIPLRPFKKRNIFGIVDFVSSLLVSSVFSFLFVMLERPRIVIGFGGYISGPLVLSAFLLGIPTLIHEQNICPGRANFILAKFAQRIGLSFEESERYLGQKKKSVFTGNPLREDLLITDKNLASKKFGFDSGVFTILVLGGSQGARSINRNFIEALEVVKENKLNWQFIHITGLRDFNWVSSIYEKLGLRARVFDLFKDMSIAYGACDLVITRAGASTLNELSYLAKPAIAIPYPYSGGHQLLNAKYYSKNDALIIIEEKDLTPQVLFKNINETSQDTKRRRFLGERIKCLHKPDAARLLAEEVWGLIYAN